MRGDLSCCQELKGSIQPGRLELANRCRQIKTVTQSLSLASVSGSLPSAAATGSHLVEALHSEPTSLRCHWHDTTIGHGGNKKWTVYPTWWTKPLLLRRWDYAGRQTNSRALLDDVMVISLTVTTFSQWRASLVWQPGWLPPRRPNGVRTDEVNNKPFKLIQSHIWSKVPALKRTSGLLD